MDAAPSAANVRRGTIRNSSFSEFGAIILLGGVRLGSNRSAESKRESASVVRDVSPAVRSATGTTGGSRLGRPQRLSGRSNGCGTQLRPGAAWKPGGAGEKKLNTVVCSAQELSAAQHVAPDGKAQKAQRQETTREEEESGGESEASAQTARGKNSQTRRDYSGSPRRSASRGPPRTSKAESLTDAGVDPDATGDDEYVVFALRTSDIVSRRFQFHTGVAQREARNTPGLSSCQTFSALWMSSFASMRF